MAWNTTLDSQPTPAAIRCGSYGAPVIDSDGYVYFKTNGATAGTCWLYKFDPLTGAVVAQANLGTDIDGNRSAPIITTDYVFAANRVTNDIKVFNKADLTPRALVPVITNAVIPPGSNGFRGIAMATVNNINGNPNIYATRRDTTPNTVHCFDSVTGALMWTWQPPVGTASNSLGQMGPFWTDGGQQCFTIVFGGGAGWSIIALQDSGGNAPPATLWSSPFAENSIMGNGALSPDGTRIYLGSDGATALRALDRATGAVIWSVPSSETLGGDLIPSPAVVDTPTGPRIYIGCRGNNLNVIDDLGAGYNVAWKLTMGQWMETSGLAVTKNSTTGRTYVYVTTEGYAPNPAAVATLYCVEDQGAAGVVLAERVIENLGQPYSAPSICATATGEIYCTSRAAGFFKFLPAPIPTGACCLPGSMCDVRSEYSCEKAGGAYIGDDSTCDPDPCLGACCIEETGECSLTYPLDCAGIWHGDWTTCDPNPCPQPPLGACCFDDGQCLVGVTQYYCEEQQGGLWQGADTTCVPNPCHERGACCLPGRCCQDAVIKEDCIAAGGTFMGPYTQCSSVQCPGDVDIDFETPRYALGDVAGQECWVLRGGPSASAAVITGDSGPSGEGGDSQCLELSNAAGDIRVDRLFQDVIGGGGVLTYQYDRKGMPTGAWFYDSSPQGPWMPSWWSPGWCQWYGYPNHDKTGGPTWCGGAGFPSMEDGQWHTLKYKLVYGDPDGENSGELISITVDGTEYLVLNNYKENDTPVSFFDVSLSPGWDGVRDDVVRVDNYLVIGEPYPSVPTADAGPDGALSFGDVLTLDASASSTTNGAVITRYRWMALTPGQLETAGLMLYDGPDAVVTMGACFTGSYTFLLQVFDSNEMRDTDTAEWTIGPAPLVNPITVTFESPDYTLGPLVGQECWAGGGAGTSSVISGDSGPGIPGGDQCAELTNIGYTGEFYQVQKSFADLVDGGGPLVTFQYDYKVITTDRTCPFFPQLTGMTRNGPGIGHWHANYLQWMGAQLPTGANWMTWGRPYNGYGQWHTFKWTFLYRADLGGKGQLLTTQVDGDPPVMWYASEGGFMRDNMADLVDKCMLTLTDWFDGNTKTLLVDNVVVRGDPLPSALPVADAGPEITGDTCTPVTLDGSGSTDDGTIVRYRWTQGWGGPSVYDGPDPTPSLLLPAGTYMLVLEVIDDTGLRGYDTTQASIDLFVPPPVNPIIIDFEAPDYTVGPLPGQQCWISVGAAGTSSVISGDNGPGLPGEQCADLTNIGYEGQSYRVEKSFQDLLGIGGPLVMFKYDYKGYTTGWACPFFPQLTGMWPDGFGDARGIGHWHTNYLQWMGASQPGGSGWGNYGHPFDGWGEWHTFRWILKYSPDEGGIGRLLSVQVDDGPPIIPSEYPYMRNTMVDLVDKCMLWLTDGWDGNNDDVKVDNIVVRAKPYSDIGACCLFGGGCADMTEAECATSGQWQGIGVTCAEDWDGNPVVCPPIPINDPCAGAIAVEVPSVVEGDTTYASMSDPVPPGVCSGDTQRTADVWYTLIGDGYEITIDMCTQPVYWDSQLAVYRGTCATGLECVTNDDDFCGGGGPSQVTFASIAGQTYTVRVFGWDYQVHQYGPFVLTITTTRPMGACCVATTCVPGKTLAECGVLGGVYQGDNTDCFPNPCGAPMAYWYATTGAQGGTGWSGGWWLHYPSGWINQWWENEFDLNRQKRVDLAFTVQFAVPGPAPIVAVNYTAQDWTEPLNPPMDDPPIVRIPVELTHGPGDYTFSTLLPFCPLWVSVDVMQVDGADFTIEGTIVHVCVTPPSIGACCLAIQPGHPVVPCVEVTAAECQAQGGVFQGVGTVCNPVATACYGDADCSGAVNFDDINYFVAALAGGEPGWSGYYASKHGGTLPPCSFWNCDANGSGRCDTPQAPEVNFDDINPFVAELVTPPACP
jgi:hypothetical protein